MNSDHIVRHFQFPGEIVKHCFLPWYTIAWYSDRGISSFLGGLLLWFETSNVWQAPLSKYTSFHSRDWIQGFACVISHSSEETHICDFRSLTNWTPGSCRSSVWWWVWHLPESAVARCRGNVLVFACLLDQLPTFSRRVLPPCFFHFIRLRISLLSLSFFLFLPDQSLTPSRQRRWFKSISWWNCDVFLTQICNETPPLWRIGIACFRLFLVRFRCS